MRTILAAVLSGLFGCGTTHADNAASAASYEATQLACVDQAKTLAESRACRCAHPAPNGHEPSFCADGGVK